MSNSIRIVNKSWRKGSKMESSITPQSLAISDHSSMKDTPTHIRAWLQSLVLASHVNPSLLPGNSKLKMIPEISGLPPLMLFAELDQGTASWKMCQDSYRGSTGTLKRYSKTWPRAGIMLNGKLSQQPKWERRTNETDSSSLRINLWPTPTVSGNHNRKGASKTSGDGLATVVQMFPTPAARDWKDGNHPSERARHTPPLAVHAGGKLNPVWVEWLMGWPLGWTDLKPLEMDKFQRWLRLHGKS